MLRHAEAEHDRQRGQGAVVVFGEQLYAMILAGDGR